MLGQLGTSAQTYHGTLAAAGGQELQACTRADVLHVAQYASPPYRLEVPGLDVARLSINLLPGTVSGRIDSGPPRTFIARRHSLFLTPRGATARWQKDAPSRHVNLYFDERALEVETAVFGGSSFLGLTPLLNARLPGLGALVDALALELAGNHPFRAEALDSLSRMILVRLGRHLLQRRSRLTPLTRALHLRLVDFVRARLDQRILVTDMAAVVGLAPSYFAEVFVRSTGESPHQFVLRLRVQRAVELLGSSHLPLAHVAAECGFSSQQHMTRVMRAKVGLTPAQQRASTALETSPGDTPSRSAV